MVNPYLGQRVYLDASTIIYAIETPAQYPGLRTDLIEPMTRGELILVTSSVSLVEVLVHPIKNGDKALESIYRQFLTPTTHFLIQPVDNQVAVQAADLRARHGLRTPDAIHIATGKLLRCSVFVSGDSRWAKIVPCESPA